LGFWGLFWLRIFRAKIYIFQQVFKEFLVLKDLIFILFLKELENHLKRKFFGNWFDFHFQFYLEFFPRVFL